MKHGIVGMSLSEFHRERLSKSGHRYTEVPLLSYEYNYSLTDLRSLLYQRADTVLVVTSGRVLPVLEQLVCNYGPVNKAGYFVGKRTSEGARGFGIEIRSWGENSEGLLKKVNWSKNRRYIYLCGDLRQNVLGNFWKENRIDFEEIQVYRTHLLQPIVNISSYDFAVVASPSGVRSLTSQNRFPANFPFASIGPRTSGELRQLGFNNIYQSEDMTFSSLIEVIDQQWP